VLALIDDKEKDEWKERKERGNGKVMRRREGIEHGQITFWIFPFF